MIAQKMVELGKKRSTIREIFEYSKKRKLEIGEKNVFDFSLGNPSINPPIEVENFIKELLETKSPTVLHGYTSATGDLEVRKKISSYIKNTFSCDCDENSIYMTCGAAASLTISLNAIVNSGDEILVLAPFFPEYKVFIEKAGGKVVIIQNKEDFSLNLTQIEKAINKNTKAIIINSPNNPTGKVISKEQIISLSKILNNKQKEFNSEIYIIADEPYRELVYDGVEVPFIPNYYNNTIVCYSFSKSLSLAGERIGYIFVPLKVENKDLYYAICGAGRVLGYVCAPSTFQFVVANCLGKTSDIEKYQKNRKTMYEGLKKIGYDIVSPDGAFYLFVKALEKDANKFYERAKKYELLVVPSDSFGVEGYVRIAYCVDYDTIVNSLPKFEELYKEYNS